MWLVALPDAEIVGRARSGDSALFEILMRRHNQRVYCVVRAVVKDETDVEDVMQQADINAFTHLRQFEERSQFSTWLIRIALNESFGRPRKMRLSESMAQIRSDDDDRREFMETLPSPQADPERQAYAQELHRVLEAAVETGQGLGLGEEAVKTRLHRARANASASVERHQDDAEVGILDECSTVPACAPGVFLVQLLDFPVHIELR